MKQMKYQLLSCGNLEPVSVPPCEEKSFKRERAEVLADCALLKKNAEYYKHPELGITSPNFACHSRPSAKKPETSATSKSFISAFCFAGLVLFGCSLADTARDMGIVAPRERPSHRRGRRFPQPPKNSCTSGTNSRKKDCHSRRYTVKSGQRRSRDLLHTQIPRKVRQSLRRQHDELSKSLADELLQPGAFASSEIRRKYNTVWSKSFLFSSLNCLSY